MEIPSIWKITPIWKTGLASLSAPISHAYLSDLFFLVYLTFMCSYRLYNKQHLLKINSPHMGECCLDIDTGYCRRKLTLKPKKPE